MKKIVVVASLLISMSLCFTLSASAQMNISSYTPAATATPPGSFYYVVDNQIPYDNVVLSWQFSKGMDEKFAQNIANITVKEKGSSTEIQFDNSTGSTTQPAPGYETDPSSLLIQNDDFTYLKTGSIRLLTLQPTTVAFESGKTYVVTIDNATTTDNGTERTFQANNGNVLQHIYSFEFTAKDSDGTTTTTVVPTTTTTIAPATTTTVMPAATTTTTVRCLATKVLGADNPKLENLRAFRDSRLAQSAVGRRIINIYYSHANVIDAALERSPSLRSAARRVLVAVATMATE